MQNITIFLFALAALYCEAKYFETRCDLVEELRRQEFPEDKMRDWVCLIEKQSERKTHKIGSVSKDGSKDFGLFQINEKYWCSNTGIPGRDCNVTCVDLLSDDITKAATCAKLIFERHNFLAWYGWRNSCLGHTLPDISNCQYNCCRGHILIKSTMK